MQTQFDVAIVGGGPAGSTLAALLAMRGIKAIVFDDEKRPALLVGESLLPTVVMLMRRLGIEDRVKAFSTHKPGVAFIPRKGSRLDFFFPEKALGKLPNYAYNIPRPEFDNLLRDRAIELGAVFVKRRAGFEPGSPDCGREIQLDAETLANVPELGGIHPRLLVDSTGRARTFAKVLGIGAVRGKRNDVAYFAHFENFESDAAREGQVVISTLTRGWSWRIPLQGRLSVGIVVDKEAAKTHGTTPEERLESIIASEPLLRDAGKNRRRVTEVMTYTNYQLISDRGHGPGWAAAGDAFGFVDPMLSSGLFMAMLSAELLEKHVFAAGAAVLDQPQRMARGFDRVFTELRDWHQSWEKIIAYFYDGRMYSLYEGGQKLREKYSNFAIASVWERHLSKQITGMVSGARTRSRYAQKMLKFTSDHMVWGVAPPEEYAILKEPKQLAGV
jgi:flavin-dependent dehydrogenase